MHLSSPVAELPPFPKAVQRRLTRKGPSCVNPWKAGKLSVSYESAEALSQQEETKNVQKTVDPACEDSDGSEDEGFLFLSGYTEKRNAACAPRPIKRNGKRGKLTTGDKDFTSPEAISRLIKGY